MPEPPAGIASYDSQVPFLGGPCIFITPFCFSTQPLLPPHLQHHPPSTPLENLYMRTPEAYSMNAIIPASSTFQSTVIPKHTDNLPRKIIPLRPIPKTKINPYNNSESKRNPCTY